MAKEHEYKKDEALNIAVLTVSDTRQMENDRGGDRIRKMFTDAGHHIARSLICQDDREEIQRSLEELLADESIHGVVATGGTGLGYRDVTVESIVPYFTKEITGFGELFRMLSYTEDVGSKALLSRAEAGVIKDQVVYILPGSVKAVGLAMEKLVLPELHHIVHEITKHKHA